MARQSPQEAARGRLGLFERWATAGHFCRPAPSVGSVGQTSARRALLRRLNDAMLCRSWLLAKRQRGKSF